MDVLKIVILTLRWCRYGVGTPVFFVVYFFDFLWYFQVFLLLITLLLAGIICGRTYESRISKKGS